MIAVLFFIIITILGGLVISYVIRGNIWLTISLGFGLGLFTTSIVGFIFLVEGVAINPEALWFTLFLFLAVALPKILGLIKGKNYFSLANSVKSAKLFIHTKPTTSLILLISLIIFVALLVESLYWPITAWDAITLYDFRGRLLADGFLLHDLAILDQRDPYNPGYLFSHPLLTSIIHAYFYKLGNISPQMIYPFVYLFTGLLFYGGLRDYSSKLLTGLFTILFLINPAIMRWASVPYSNLIYIFFYLASTMLLIKGLAQQGGNRLGLIFFSSVFLAASIWTRSVEPFYLVNILFLIGVVIVKKKDLRFIPIFLFLPLLLRYFWLDSVGEYSSNFFTNNMNIHYLANAKTNLDIEILLKASNAIKIFILNNSQILGLFVLVKLLTFKKTNNQYKLLFTLLLISILILLFVGTYLVALIFSTRLEILDSIHRTGLIIVPFIYYIVAMDLYSPKNTIKTVNNKDDKKIQS